jgi:hypothetical protein
MIFGALTAILGSSIFLYGNSCPNICGSPFSFPFYPLANADNGNIATRAPDCDSFAEPYFSVGTIVTSFGIIVGLFGINSKTGLNE